MNRRTFLKIAGSSAIIVAAGSTGFVATRSPTDALKPWQTPGAQYQDPMQRSLSYAILAPNPHNRQPWVVELKTTTEAVLSCDLGRLLPATDPFSRQIIIGLGCFLELFSIAAAEQGYMADIQYFPEGEPQDRLDSRPIAHLTLKKQDNVAPDPLFTHILKRHTNRDPYDDNRPITDELSARLRKAAQGPVHAGVHTGVVNGGKLQRDLRLLTRDAMVAEINTPEAYQESIDLMRIGRAEIEANPDGISLGGAFLEGLNLAGILTRENLADPASRSFQIGLNMIDQSAMSSMGFVWLTTPGNTRTEQIEAGRAYMRIALQVAADGLVMQPMSQALQEYDAMAPYLKVVHDKLTNLVGERVQMLARLGYAKKDIGPAPRWPLKSRIKGS
ncbi:MAG: hypothetical protein JKY27_06320 [Magnetovibrio sp.]|nr:hypothetical protein [Magnetovibrio sp.]